MIVVISVRHCCFGQEILSVTAELGDTTSYEEVSIPLNGGCSLGCGMSWRMTASSHLAGQAATSYVIDNIEDGDPSTAWIEGKNGYGIGEQIIIQFEGIDTLDIVFL